MLARAYLTMLLLTAVPLWSQVETDPADTTNTVSDDSRMRTPPPVSGAAYPITPLSETRSNYLRGGLTFETAYNDNVLGGTSSNPVSDVSYSIWPSIELDRTVSRMRWVLSYTPGFTFYQRLDQRNHADQNVGAEFQYRLSPHVTLDLRDSFHKLSSYSSQPNLLSGEPVTGSAQGPTVAVVTPVSDQLYNVGNAEISYQCSANAMVGASGTFTNLHYSNPAQVPGLFDSAAAGGAASYTHRLAKKHYVGATYEYQRILSYPVGAQNEVQTHSVLLFYTVYFKPTLSLSLSGGPQHSDVSQAPSPSSQAWSPAGTVSFGWQGRHTTLAARYSRIVTGGGGLLGAFHSNLANASFGQQLTRNWSVGAAAGYSIYSTLTPFFFLSNPGGHSISGNTSVQRKLGQHLSVQAGYTRLHQSYSTISAVSKAPDTNWESVSISYQFTRPLGR